MLVALALLAGVCVVASPGDSAAAGGARVKALTCLNRCGGPRLVARSGEVKLTGRGLGGTVEVRFSGDAGPVSATPAKVGARAVQVVVPAAARSGRVRAVDGQGAVSASPRRLRVVPRRRVPRPGSFELTGSTERPNPGFLLAAHPLSLRYRFQSDRRIGLRIVVVRRKTDAIVAGWVEHRVSPFGRHHRSWNGLRRDGTPAPDGDYQFRVGKRGGYLHPAGTFGFHGHYFPVQGPHWDRGYWGQFGVPRSGGRTHEGYDVMAHCGTPLVAVRAGRVERRGYSPDLYGNYVQIDGVGEHRDYFYAHLRAPAKVALGARVRTGQSLGAVGETGNARSVGCHLHLEIHVHGHPIDPKPDLTRWDRWS